MKLIYKLNAVTLLSTIVVIFLLFFSIMTSQKNNRVLSSIEKGYFPSLLINKDLEGQLLSLKRNFLDAGMAGDQDKLNETESIFENINANLEKFKSYDVAVDTSLKSLKENFEKYYTTSKSVVSDMITGNMGEDFGQKTTDMNFYYEKLEKSISQSDEYFNKMIESSFQKSSALIRVIIRFLFILAFASLSAFLAGLFFSKKVIDVIIGIVDRLQDIAQGEGDLTKTIVVHTRDEIGELAKWFNSFVDKIKNVVKSIAEEAGTLIMSTSEMESISNSINKNAQEMSTKAAHTARSTDELKHNMGNVSTSVEESNANINTVASSAEEMSVTISEILSNTEKAKTSTENALLKVNTSVENVNEFGKKAQEIGKIIDTINEISDQTNLLSLNATIEAARAGDAGKGFAVVANEIKELATQSNDAANNIAEMITSIQNSIETTVLDMRSIDQVINEVNSLVQDIAKSIENQSIATREITDNISQVSTVLNHITGSIQKAYSFVDEVATDTDESKKISNQVNHGINNIANSAFELKEMANRLNELVGKFTV
ncbi:MAG: HAMP domain-containing protein [Candidatus Marinimicrobia bacterium]|nr:HAMP domain-containing protein [Candidatus Neomarinimicrobiota bacterium]